MPAHDQLLSEAGIALQSLRSPPPRSFEQAITQCFAQQKELFELLKRLPNKRIGIWRRTVFRRKNKVVERTTNALYSFKSSVCLVRDIAMEWVHPGYVPGFDWNLLVKLHINCSKSRLLKRASYVSFWSSKAGRKMALEPNSNLTRYNSGDPNPQTARFLDLNADPSLINVTIAAGLATERPQWVPARGKLDTGSEANSISREVIERGKISEKLIPVDGKKKFAGIEGSEFVPTSKITIAFFMNNAMNSHETEFFLVEQADFDVLLGNPFIRQHIPLAPRDPVLILQHRRRTAGKNFPQASASGSEGNDSWLILLAEEKRQELENVKRQRDDAAKLSVAIDAEEAVENAKYKHRRQQELMASRTLSPELGTSSTGHASSVESNSLLAGWMSANCELYIYTCISYSVCGYTTLAIFIDDIEIKESQACLRWYCLRRALYLLGWVLVWRVYRQQSTYYLHAVARCQPGSNTIHKYWDRDHWFFFLLAPIIVWKKERKKKKKKIKKKFDEKKFIKRNK